MLQFNFSPQHPQLFLYDSSAEDDLMLVIEENNSFTKNFVKLEIEDAQIQKQIKVSVIFDIPSLSSIQNKNVTEGILQAPSKILRIEESGNIESCKEFKVNSNCIRFFYVSDYKSCHNCLWISYCSNQKTYQTFNGKDFSQYLITT